jgi:nucleotide-binding universal stress UspA family protein
MYRSLLVPLDGSPFAEHALALALSIAKRAEAEVKLVYVYDPLQADYSEANLLTKHVWTTEWTDRYRAYLDDIAQRLGAGGAKITAPAILQGDVSSTICRYAIDNQVDLVVMTTHARGPVARMWLGSVADRLIRELSRPVLLVRPSDEKVDLTADPIFRHALIPLDGTPAAEEILKPGVALGELMGAEYTLLRVVRPGAPVHYPPEGALPDSSPESIREQLQRVDTELRRQGQEYLDEVAHRLRGDLLRVHTRVIQETHAAEAVIDAAQELSSDLIAMQTHGRRGVSRLLLGSVADKVLRGSKVPLLLQGPPYSAG